MSRSEGGLFRGNKKPPLLFRHHIGRENTATGKKKKPGKAQTKGKFQGPES